MNLRPSKLKLLPPIAAALAMVLSAGAQQDGQSIIFSAPQNPDNSAGAPALTPQNSGHLNLADAPQASQPFFNTPDDTLPLPQQQRTFSPAEQQRMKKLLDDRKNWELLTPDEILGLTMPDKMSQTPNSLDAASEDQTPVERFLARQDQMRMGNTNADGWQNDDQNSPWNLSRSRQADNPFAPADNGLKDPMQKQNRLQDGEPENGGASANQNDNSILSLLGVTQPQQQPTAQNTEQLASMERFRQLLEENSASAAGTTPTPNDKFFPAPKQTPDPNMTPTVLANPIGSPFTPLSDSIGRPVGLTPLPGIVTPISHPAAAPSWAPKPAPWLSQTPDAFTIPQPRF